MTTPSEAYCIKCKTKRKFEGELDKFKNGRPVLKGVCPKCETKLFRILSQADADKIKEAK